MKWIREEIPLSVTRNNLDPFENFFNSQKEQEESEINVTPLTDEGIQNVDDAAVLIEKIQNSSDAHANAPYIKVTYETIPFEFISRLVEDQNYLIE